MSHGATTRTTTRTLQEVSQMCRPFSTSLFLTPSSLPRSSTAAVSCVESASSAPASPGHPSCRTALPPLPPRRHEGLSGAVEVGDVLDGTAIDQVVALGGTTVAREAVLETQGFVRPTFVGGSLVLHVRPGADGVLMPFEQPDPAACCADHG